MRSSSPLSEDDGPWRRVSALCVLVCSVAIVWFAWRERYFLNPDGMSYIDLAQSAAQGQVSALIHRYWSPLYPALLGALFAIVRPSPATEVLWAHALNMVIGVAALASFRFFLIAWFALSRDTLSAGIRPYFAAFGYAVFLWSTVQITTLGMITPDLLVNTFVFAASAFACRIFSGVSRADSAVALGICLGLGFLAKAALLPLGIALLLIAALLSIRNRERPALSQWAVATLVFGVVSLPLIAALSVRAGHLSFGDTGAINYAWKVQRDVPEAFGWTEGSSRAGFPLHPPRVLSTQPRVLEYRDTVPGSYPPWYDPAYFYDGVRIRFDAAKQISVLGYSLHALWWAHGRTILALLAGFLALIAATRGSVSRKTLGSGVWLLIWTCSAFLLYGLVLMQARYVSGFLAVFWLSVFSLAVGRGGSAVNQILAVTAGAVTIISVYVALASGQEKRPRDFDAAPFLKTRLTSGDTIAIVGSGFDAYFAQLTGTHVIAEIEESQEYWSRGHSASDSPITHALADAGARAIVSPTGCPGAPTDWARDPVSGYCVLELSLKPPR